MAFRRFSRTRRPFRRFTGRRAHRTGTRRVRYTKNRGRYRPSARRIRIGYRM